MAQHTIVITLNQYKEDIATYQAASDGGKTVDQWLLDFLSSKIQETQDSLETPFNKVYTDVNGVVDKTKTKAAVKILMGQSVVYP